MSVKRRRLREGLNVGASRQNENTEEDLKVDYLCLQDHRINTRICHEHFRIRRHRRIGQGMSGKHRPMQLAGRLLGFMLELTMSAYHCTYLSYSKLFKRDTNGVCSTLLAMS